MSIFLLIVLALLALAASAFCSGTETAFLSVSRERILHMAREGGRKARIVQEGLADLGRTTTTILIGNNLSNVIYSYATAALSAALLNDTAAEVIWSFLAAFIVLYTSEFMPKLLCSARPLRRVLGFADAYRVMAWLLRPLTDFALWVTDFFLPRREKRYKLTATDLMRILQDRKDGVCLSDVESALITRLIVLRVKRKPITPEAILSALE